MRWRLWLLLFSFAAACSRRPSASQVYSKAWIDFRQGRLQQAQQAVDKALKGRDGDRPKEALEPLRLLQTEILLARGQPSNALSLLGQLPDPKDPDEHLRWMVDCADALSKLPHQADKATALLNEVDKTAGDKGGDWVFKGRLLRAAMLANALRFDQAEAILRNLLTLTIAAGDSYNQASALINLSFSQIKRNHCDESIRYSSPALELAEKIHAGRIVAVANNNLGIAYTALHDLDRAADYQDKAIAQLREIDDLRNLEDALGELGNIHLLRHKPVQAAQAFEEAFNIASRTDATGDALRWAHRLAFAMIEQKNWDAADSWNGKAYALREQFTNPDKGLYLRLNTAAILHGRGKSDASERLYRDLIADSKDSPYVEWYAHMRLGALLADKKDFDDANTEYELGLAASERIRSALLEADYRLSYQDLQVEFFKEYVDLLVKEGDSRKALQVAEYSRARVLAEKLGVKPGSIGEVDPTDFQRYARRTGSILVSYWLAQRRSFVWVIKPDGIQIHELRGEDELGSMIRAYQKTVEKESRDPVQERLPQGESLSKALLGPIHDDLGAAHKVVVVPDGELHALNLETLPAGDMGHYWIEDVEISIAPSLSVASLTPPRKRSKPSLLLVGAADNADFPELPAAKAEIEGIQHRFAGAEMVRTATPQGFLDAVPSHYSLIHFAAHAETNSRSPLESAVILSGSNGDYKLYARAVTTLNLSADLVTISACRSAGARAYGGEGLVGFAWAFLRSGAGAVIAGLWDVSDSSSSQLMAKLYDSLANGVEPPTALHQAKLALLHSTGSYRKPFYWAPYQIYIR
jgi:CHAT domain-containing protein